MYQLFQDHWVAWEQSCGVPPVPVRPAPGPGHPGSLPDFAWSDGPTEGGLH